MDKELKDKWVDALRSGEYKQARQALYRPGEGYCCLGVLCDVGQLFDWDGVSISLDTHREYTIISDEQARSIGLVNANDKLVDQELMTMNDTDGLSFIAIADWIERNVI